jgi:hypothetical protein
MFMLVVKRDKLMKKFSRFLHDDSKLLSGLPWPIILKTKKKKNKNKLLTEYERVTKKIFISYRINIDEC